METACVGLFGTCEKSTWRADFIAAFTKAVPPIKFFNPQVPADKWNDLCIPVESHHLANDAVIVFPVLSESYAIGSLAEIGFSIIQASRFDQRRDVVVMIAPDVDQALKDSNPELAKASQRARRLVRGHLEKLQLQNVYIVDNMDDLLGLSITLYQQAIKRDFNYPHTAHAHAHAVQTRKTVGENN